MFLTFGLRLSLLCPTSPEIVTAQCGVNGKRIGINIKQ